MTSHTLTAAALLGLALALAPFARGQAAGLEIIAGSGIAGPLKELAAQFESATGHKLTIRFATTPELIKMATSPSPVDAAVVPSEMFKDAAANARFAGSPTAEVARVGLGVAVRAGAAKPDIATPEALKLALTHAKSIATIPASAAGALVLKMFERLGIAEAIKPKTQALPGTAELVKSVAAGDAEIGVFLINVLTAPGLDVVGPVPAELNQELFYLAAVAADARQAEAAKAFIAFLRTPLAKAVIEAKGMTAGVSP